MVFSLAHEGDKTLDGHVCWTGSLTGSNGSFRDSISTGYGLFILFKDGFSRRQSLVVFAGSINGTNLGTFPAGGTF